jgi:hypothetical protein
MAVFATMRINDGLSSSSSLGAIAMRVSPDNKSGRDHPFNILVKGLLSKEYVALVLALFENNHLSLRRK